MSGPVRRRRAPGALMILALVASGSPVPAHAGASGMADSEVTIVSASGEHRFEVEVARTAEEQARGLMYRQGLASDAGMLFDYGRPRNVAMWMRNTYIPLDMIFIGADWRINAHRGAGGAVLAGDGGVRGAGPGRARGQRRHGIAARHPPRGSRDPRRRGFGRFSLT